MRPISRDKLDIEIFCSRVSVFNVDIDMEGGVVPGLATRAEAGAPPEVNDDFR